MMCQLHATIQMVEFGKMIRLAAKQY